MRHWLLVLMVLLLPLRGVVSEAMAGQMAAQAVQAAMQSQDPREVRTPVAHEPPQAHDCHEQGSAHRAGADGQAAVAASPGECPTCVHCQACSTIAVQPVLVLPLTDRFSQARPVTAHRSHASVDRAPAFKPPIS